MRLLEIGQLVQGQRQTKFPHHFLIKFSWTIARDGRLMHMKYIRKWKQNANHKLNVQGGFKESKISQNGRLVVQHSLSRSWNRTTSNIAGSDYSHYFSRRIWKTEKLVCSCFRGRIKDFALAIFGYPPYVHEAKLWAVFLMVAFCMNVNTCETLEAAHERHRRVGGPERYP